MKSQITLVMLSPIAAIPLSSAPLKATKIGSCRFSPEPDPEDLIRTPKGYFADEIVKKLGATVSIRIWSSSLCLNRLFLWHLCLFLLGALQDVKSPLQNCEQRVVNKITHDRADF